MVIPPLGRDPELARLPGSLDGSASAVPDERAERVRTPAARRPLNKRLRAEWIAGAEEEWRKRTGVPMTPEELEPVLTRSPRDA
jgi:hypothetical protein